MLKGTNVNITIEAERVLPGVTVTDEADGHIFVATGAGPARPLVYCAIADLTVVP